ncbi:hypothetical protein LPJ63_002361 [Coemansia sp. RSA 2711]|nr:hypothetical protein LPJ63_002361 [Coemansia sp. RSA 2711]KAJ2322818.1 hypothetical protein IWW51_004055 [Coemansia sp. RSA 2702]
MVQSINVPGLRALWTVITRPSLLLPRMAVPDIRSINFAALRRSGIDYVVFDKDNCLTAPYVAHIHPAYKEAWSQCLEAFAPNVLIVSNSAGTPDDPEFWGAAKVEQALGARVLRHKVKKPGCADEILAAWPDAKAEQIAVVGDRLATDVLMANRANMLSIWTQNIVTTQGDNRMAAILRKAEHAFYNVASAQRQS